MTEQELAALLAGILSDTLRRLESIGRFQQVVWNMPAVQNESPAWRILGDLAVDLDYYEPDSRRRKESSSFYGDEELESVLRKGLADLESVGVIVCDDDLGRIVE